MVSEVVRSFVCLALLTLVSACADPDLGIDRRMPIVEDVPIADKDAYAEQFPIIDARSGELTIPRTPADTSPFGVLLGFVNRHQLEMCTISHWHGNELLTNAHCIESVSKPDAYYVIYYDRDRQRRYAMVTGFGYVGNVESDDVAVLTISPEDAVRWDALDATVLSSRDSIDAGLGRGNFPVTVWSFDPLSAHPELDGSFHGRQGGVFEPKNCTGFRTEPRLNLVDQDGRSQPYPATTVDVRRHVLFDNCDHEPIPGNSGSWISAAGDPARGYGVFHWIITLRDQPIVRTFRTFEYTGSNGRLRSTPAVDNFAFYFVGTDLEAVLGEHPGAF